MTVGAFFICMNIRNSSTKPVRGFGDRGYSLTAKYYSLQHC